MKKALFGLLLLLQAGCTGSGAVNPLTPSKASQPDSAAQTESEVLYWTSFPVTFTLTDALNGVCMVSKKLGWACGNNGVVLKYDGETWAKVDTGLAKNENLLSVTFANENEGWMVGSHGTILAFKNGSWNLENTQTQENLYDVAVTRSRTVWVCGSNGTLLTYNGISWGKVTAVTETSGTSPTTVTDDLYSLGLSDQNNGWATGNRGTILRYDGQKWQPFTASPSTERLNSLFVLGDAQAWAVGAFGTILRFNGTTWNKMGTAFSGFDLYKISMLDENNGWACGQDGTLIYYDGTRWISHQKIPNKPSLNSLSFYKDVGFAVGQNGAILQFQPKGEPAKFSFLFKGEVAKKPAKENPFWTLTYTLMNQSGKSSPFLTYELPLPKNFELYQKKPSGTPTPVSPASAPGAPRPPGQPWQVLAGATPPASSTPGATPPSGPLSVAGAGRGSSEVFAAWKMKDGSMVLEIGAVASSEIKTLTVTLQEKKGEKKEYPVTLKAILKSTDRVIAESSPVTLNKPDVPAEPQTTPPSSSLRPAVPPKALMNQQKGGLPNVQPSPTPRS